MTALEDSHRLAHALALRCNARLVDTHISWVLLGEKDAWKLKKPVRLPFLDYSSPAARAACCAEEVRVNQRLAPGLYQGVVTITGTLDAPRIGGPGPVLDHAVHMARFPDGVLLCERIRAGTLSGAQVDALADRLGRFHAQAPRAPAASGFGDPAARAAAALAALEGARGALSASDADLQGAWLRAQVRALQPLWADRQAGGWVREGHGDLHLANLLAMDMHGREVLLAFDAVEFNPALRWIDVLDDIAFTVMDFDAHDRRDLGFRVLNRWLDHVGGHEGLAGLRLALAYRALVRAQVGLGRADTDGRPSCARYAACALDWRAPARAPVLTVMHGLPGSGKSWHSQALLERGAIRLRSDVERKRLAGLPMEADSRAAGVDLYGREATACTYAHLLRQADALLAGGWDVVLDAAFLRRDERDAARALAAARGVDCVLVSCEAPLAVLRARLRSRQGDPSEADETVLDRLAAKAEPLDSQERAAACIVGQGCAAPAHARSPRRALD